MAALDAQVTELQKTVAELEAQLAHEPRYFDDPPADPLRPQSWRAAGFRNTETVTAMGGWFEGV